MIRQNCKTKILFTIGPATLDVATLTQLIESGVDVCRFNMAHLDHDALRHAVSAVREACSAAGRRIGLLMDVKGPEIRTRDVEQPLELSEGTRVAFSFQPPEFTARMVSNPDDVLQIGVNYPHLAESLSAGDTVLVDSGLIRLTVDKSEAGRVDCRVLFPGTLGNRRHINLPGIHVQLPAITDKDTADLRIGVELGFDFYALSFVRAAADLQQLRRMIDNHGSEAQLIAKIEDQSGVQHLAEILESSDGLMVARGDLGVEVPFEQLPIFQRRAVDACLNAGKPVIIATHMLESMIQSPIPTRAEISDVSNAVREQADCMMLSGETAVGKFPLRCVDVMSRISRHLQLERQPGHNRNLQLETPRHKMLRSAVVLAEELPQAGILVFSSSGELPRILSAL
ncbi:MAG: pyruvate kinase, partial [Planctomycetaceae bacterium]